MKIGTSYNFWAIFKALVYFQSVLLFFKVLLLFFQSAFIFFQSAFIQIFSSYLFSPIVSQRYLFSSSKNIIQLLL
jgi:hypothetical protein